jgi:integrase
VPRPSASRPKDNSHSEPVGDRVRIFLRGKCWYANFQHAGKQQRRSLRTASKKEARRQALLLEAELLTNEFQQAPKPIGIDKLTDDYQRHLATEGRAPRTLAKYARVFDRVRELARELHRSDALGIDLSFVDAFRHRRAADGCAPKTLYTETVIVRQLVNFALSRRLIATDPLQGLKIRKPKPKPQPCWSPADVQRILDASREPQRSAFTLLAETGLRIGERCWLTWSDIDFGRNVLHVRPKNGWKPKSGDQRAVPLSPTAKALLSRLPRRARWVFTATPTSRFPTTDRQVSERRLLSTLKRVLKQQELPGHLHTFRHAFISRAVAGGIPEAIVRGWVGHVDREVLQLYTHIADADSQHAMQRLAESRGATSFPLQKE